MKPKTVLWAIFAVLVAVVVGLSMRPSGGAGVQNVDAAGAKKAIASGAQIIDVRTAGEFQMGRVPGALNAPVDQLETTAQSWDKDATYLIYCATGARSATAVETLKALGFKNITHFSAGIQAWPDALESGQASSSQKIETDGKPVLIDFYTDS